MSRPDRFSRLDLQAIRRKAARWGYLWGSADVETLVHEIERRDTALKLALGAMEHINMDTPEDRRLHQRVIDQVIDTAYGTGEDR